MLTSSSNTQSNKNDHLNPAMGWAFFFLFLFFKIINNPLKFVIMPFICGTETDGDSEGDGERVGTTEMGREGTQRARSLPLNWYYSVSVIRTFFFKIK